MKNMIKIAVPAVLAAFVLTGCGGSGKSENDIEIDVQQVADDLNGTVTSDTLSATAESMIASNFSINADDYVSGAAYMSGGATACEAAVIECTDTDAAAEVEKVFEQRKEDRKKLFESYNESEVTKIDDAVLETAGKYVAWCVTDDPDAAKKVLSDAGF